MWVRRTVASALTTTMTARTLADSGRPRSPSTTQTNRTEFDEAACRRRARARRARGRRPGRSPRGCASASGGPNFTRSPAGGEYVISKRATVPFTSVTLTRSPSSSTTLGSARSSGDGELGVTCGLLIVTRARDRRFERSSGAGSWPERRCSRRLATSLLVGLMTRRPWSPSSRAMSPSDAQRKRPFTSATAGRSSA